VVVHASAEDATAKALAHPAAPWVTSITPRLLHLKPGQTGAVTLTIAVPHGAHGTHFTNILFAAAPAGHGTVRLSAAVRGPADSDRGRRMGERRSHAQRPGPGRALRGEH
jgi:hypothetical protein